MKRNDHIFYRLRKRPTELNEKPGYTSRFIAESHVTSSYSSRVGPVELKKSEKWADACGKSKIRKRGIPYIQKSGHLSGCVVATWKCSAYQWFWTCAASIYKVIRGRHVLQKRCRRKTDTQLSLIAIYYTLTQNDSHLERLLCCQSKGFTSLLCYLKSNMDTLARFCYGQAATSAYRLKYRSHDRAQSIKKTILPQYRIFGLRSYDAGSIVRNGFNALSDPWIIKGKEAFLETSARKSLLVSLELRFNERHRSQFAGEWIETEVRLRAPA